MNANESLQAEVEALREELAELREESARGRAEIKQRVSDIEGSVVDGEAVDEEDMLPIERCSRMGMESLNNISDKRAVTIWEHFDDWSSSAPCGAVLRTADDNLLTLLDTAREGDDISDWNQVYRACEHLADLGGEKVDFVEKNNQKMLVVDQ